MARVFIDTNVLFPFSVMDLMLALTAALTEDGIHDVMWSDDVLNEWERVTVVSCQASGESTGVRIRR